jgi:hypothetical protein
MAIKRKTRKKTAVKRAAPRRKMTATPRRRTKRRGLSAASPAAIKSSLMDVAFAAGGAVIASVLKNQKFLDAQSETNKGLLLTAASIATAVVFKQPRLAAGMGAVAGLTLIKGLGAGNVVGLSERGSSYMFPISESVDPLLLPYGLEEGPDYAGLSEASIYSNNYGSNYTF